MIGGSTTDGRWYLLDVEAIEAVQHEWIGAPLRYDEGTA